MERITYQDFNLKLSGADGYYTAAVLSSPGGEGQVPFTLPFSQMELENLLLHDLRSRHLAVLNACEGARTTPQQSAQQKKSPASTPTSPRDPEKDIPADLYTFVYLPQSKGWIGKYPVTNLQYQRFLEAPDFAEQRFWMNFPKFGPPPDYQLLGDWGDTGWQWLQEHLKDEEFSPDGQRVVPRYWQEVGFGIQRPLVPVVGVTWYEANAYSNWLQAHWEVCEEVQQNPDLGPGMLRLPIEAEWEEAAGGSEPAERCVWDGPGKVTRDPEEIVRRANVWESEIWRTTPVNTYLLGQSPLGVWDMAGNVWEWQANFFSKTLVTLALRGGSWSGGLELARLSVRSPNPPHSDWRLIGFRVFFSPS